MMDLESQLMDLESQLVELERSELDQGRSNRVVDQDNELRKRWDRVRAECRRIRTVLAATLIGLPCLLASGVPLRAQVWQGDVGVAMPVAEFADMMSWGPSVAASVSQPLFGEVGIRIRGEVAFLRGTPVDVRPVQLLVGPFAHVKGSEDTVWQVTVDALIGGTYFARTGDWVVIPENPMPRESQLSRSLSASAGLEVSRELGEGFALVLQGRLIRMFTSGERREGFPGRVEEGFGALSLLPFGVGLRWIR